MTINVINEDRLEGDLPTIALLDAYEVRAIQGIPADVDNARFHSTPPALSIPSATPLA
jgi:hypothetical protein